MSLWNLGSATARIVGENTSSWFDPPERNYDENGKRIPLYSGSGCSAGARDIGRSSSVSETDGVRRTSGSETTYYTIDAGVDFKTWHRDNETSWFSRLFE